MSLSDKAINSFRGILIASLLGIIVLSTVELTHPLITRVNDKLEHVLAFAYLAFLVDFSFPGNRHGLLKVLLLLAYGVLIEVIQYFIPYRMFSFLDVLADGVGIIVYGLSIPVLKRIPILKLRWHG